MADTTEDETKRNWLSGLPWWVYALIGAFVVILIVAVTLGIVASRHHTARADSSELRGSDNGAVADNLSTVENMSTAQSFAGWTTLDAPGPGPRTLDFSSLGEAL